MWQSVSVQSSDWLKTFSARTCAPFEQRRLDARQIYCEVSIIGHLIEAPLLPLCGVW